MVFSKVLITVTQKMKIKTKAKKKNPQVVNVYYVYYDAMCNGYYSNHGKYSDVYDAEVFAKELVCRLGGQSKILNKNKGQRIYLGHVGALETHSDGRGEYAGYRKPFDPKIHEYFGKKK